MNNSEAIGVAEGYIEAESEEQYIAAWQHLINTGLAWSLQGWFGRQATAMIENEVCVMNVDDRENKNLTTSEN